MKPIATFYSFRRFSADHGTVILRNGVEPLRLPPDGVCRLTATQFEWGYEGSGAEVTTVVLLTDFLEVIPRWSERVCHESTRCCASATT